MIKYYGHWEKTFHLDNIIPFSLCIEMCIVIDSVRHDAYIYLYFDMMLLTQFEDMAEHILHDYIPRC